jgi:hypothetical protein
MSTDIAPQGVEERAPAGAPAFGVPWWTVLSLGVALAFADGFWVGSLRNAVGAIERTQTPFASWVRESSLAIPLFVLAVLGALTLARRWVTGSGDRPRQVLLTGLLVVGAGTLVGVAELAASAAYDYRLQLQQNLMMGTMRQTCTGSCLAAQDAASFWLQAKAVGWGGLILLVTNFVLVGWAVAFFGGRLRTTTPRAGAWRSAGRADELRTVLVAGLVGSAVIHAAVVPEHRSEWAAAGGFFVLLTVAELAAAWWLLRGARPMSLLAAVVVSVGPLVLWLWSRTTGLPFGPEPGVPEAVGLADSAACLLEVVTLVLAVSLLRRSAWTRRPTSPATHPRSLALVALVAVTAIGLAGTGLAWFHVVVDTAGHTGHAG